jgi:hypothetical protein
LYGSFAPQYLYGLAAMENVTVLCSKEGKPVGARTGSGVSTRWVSSLDNWKEVAEPEALGRIWDVQQHFNVGYAPTKGSLGDKFSRRIYTSRQLGHHTSPSLACDAFIREHCVGQMCWTPGTGYYSILDYMDMHAAFLRYWYIHPTGTARHFTEERYTSDLATYFARCTVVIHEPLPLGPFPKVGKGEHNKRKVYYPTEPGVYGDIYISKEQVDDCRKAGCTVNVYEGFGWADLTTDNQYFAQEAYWKREVNVPSNAEEKVKGIPLAFIGRQKQDRFMRTLVSLDRANDDEPVVIDNEGRPYPYAIRKIANYNRAIMIHWWWYTVTECNRAVYNFALPFAKAGRLIMIDYDAIMVLDGNDKYNYIRKFDIGEVFAVAGDWKWRELHNVSVLGDRTFESDELTHKPGNWAKHFLPFVDDLIIATA